MSTILQRLHLLLGDELARKLLGPGFFALVIKVASAGLSYVMLVAFARMLDAENYGQFGVMLNISIALSTLVSVGFPTAIMRFWSGHLARGENALAKGFYNGALSYLAFVSVLLIAAGFSLSWSGWMADYFGFRQGAFLVATLASLIAFDDFYASALRAQDKVLWGMLPRDVVWRTMAPTLAFGLLWSTGSLRADQAILSCLLVMIAVVASEFIVSARAAQRIAGSVSPQTNWPHWIKPLLPLAGASVLFGMVQQLDVVVIGAFLGAEQAGAYFAAQKTASLLGLVMIAGGLVAAPMMASAYQAGHLRDLQRLCKMLALAIAVLTVIGFAIVVLIGEPLLAIFDPAYRSAYPLLVILAFGYMIDALAGPTAYLMQMTSLEGSYLRIMAIVYAFVLTLQIVLVPVYGAIAAAGATALGVCLWNAIAIYQLRKSIGIDSSILSYFLPPRSA